MGQCTSVLIAIANHGVGNRQYLDQLIQAYKSMPIDARIVVLSNIPKDLGPEVEVVVGVPSKNPWSLPFAHRPLFRECCNDFDYFIYSEDDTLMRWETLSTFIDTSQTLEPNEIAGFMRTETGPDGRVYYSTSHSFFRWIPRSVRKRGGRLWASFSNAHAACFVAPQNQLNQAIESGGFGDEPHEGRYDMLCAAATDIYTSCGFERLVDVDDLDTFALKHLPNKYIGRMGLPSEEMAWQIEALHRVEAGELSACSLVQPETKLPGSVGSKRSRETPDPVIEQALNRDAKRVLVWCSGDGIAEQQIAAAGHDVTVQPLDAILGFCCERRGLRSLKPNLKELENEKGRFDAIVMRDTLHLIEDPITVLAQLRKCLRPGGQLIVRVPNFSDVRMLRRKYGDPRFQMPWTKERINATPLSRTDIREMILAAGFARTKALTSIPPKRVRANRASFGIFRNTLSPYIYLVANN